MKTLVIHPEDSSTWFLNRVYENIENLTLVIGNVSKNIWCNADQFVDRFDLKGFYTGMFISEVGEAYYCGLPGTKQPEVDESNFKFVDLMGEHINNETIKIHEKVKEQYGLLVEHNPVANYNHQRLYLNL